MIPVIEGWNHDVNLFVLKAMEKEKYLKTKMFCTDPINYSYKNLI